MNIIKTSLLLAMIIQCFCCLSQSIVATPDIRVEDAITTLIDMNTSKDLNEIMIHIEDVYHDSEGRFHETTTKTKGKSRALLAIRADTFITYDYFNNIIESFNFDGKIIKSKKLDSHETVVNIGTKGSFIVTDWRESYGTYLEVFNAKFEGLKIIKPYEGKGFKEIIMQDLGSISYILFSTSKNSLHTEVIKVDNETGETLNQYRIPFNSNIIERASFKFSENFIVIIFDYNINIINEEGEIVSASKIPVNSLLNIQILEDNNQFFAYQYRTGDLYSYDIITLKELHKRNLISLLDERIKVTPQIGLLENSQSIVFYFDELKKRKTAEILVISSSGEIKNSIVVPDGSPNELRRMKISKSQNNIYLFNQEKIKCYEIR